MPTRRKKIILGGALLLALGVSGTVALLFKDAYFENRYIRMLSSEDEATTRRSGSSR
jgi:hypothetical protein